MSISTTPLPVPGDVIDPPAKPAPEKVKDLDARDDVVGTTVGVGFRSFTRFSDSKATLLAAGTTYYLFLAMFSIIAFAYGLTAALGAERMADAVTEAVSEAFPGLLGDSGIDADQLRAVGQTTSLIGAIGLLYGGTGAVLATVRSVHLIFGAAKDPRNVVVARLRALAWLLVLGLLIMLSFIASTLATSLSTRVFDALGVDWSGPNVLLTVGSLALTLAINFLVVYLVVGHLGGIRPPRHARVIGAAVGAVVIEILKSLMALLVELTIDKPQYGALAAPIGILFVLYLQCVTLYAAASLTAGIAERDVPLEVLEASDTQEARAVTEG
ncbi:MAG: YhjD/YihY/BrkB family envelope integrity protein [Candidatus Nanopelagicales bacterium]